MEKDPRVYIRHILEAIADNPLQAFYSGTQSLVSPRESVATRRSENARASR
jgi:hypothetical protein